MEAKRGAAMHPCISGLVAQADELKSRQALVCRYIAWVNEQVQQRHWQHHWYGSDDYDASQEALS